MIQVQEIEDILIAYISKAGKIQVIWKMKDISNSKWIVHPENILDGLRLQE